MSSLERVYREQLHGLMCAVLGVEKSCICNQCVKEVSEIARKARRVYGKAGTARRKKADGINRIYRQGGE